MYRCLPNVLFKFHLAGDLQASPTFLADQKNFDIHHSSASKYFTHTHHSVLLEQYTPVIHTPVIWPLGGHTIFLTLAPCAWQENPV